MEGNFRDGKNSLATIAGMIILIVGLIVMPIIQVKFDLGSAFTLIVAPVMVFLIFAVDSMLSKGEFSADEKSVAFSLGFSKYDYSYKNIINVKTETTFTNSRYGKILHIEIMLSLRNGKIVRFDDAVSKYEYDTMEDLKKLQERHQFTKLAEYIQGFIKQE